jgi:hypothetical protein
VPHFSRSAKVPSVLNRKSRELEILADLPLLDDASAKYSRCGPDKAVGARSKVNIDARSYIGAAWTGARE